MYPVCRGTQGKTASSVPYADMIHSCVQCTVLLSASPRRAPPVQGSCHVHCTDSCGSALFPAVRRHTQLQGKFVFRYQDLRFVTFMLSSPDPHQRDAQGQDIIMQFQLRLVLTLMFSPNPPWETYAERGQNTLRRNFRSTNCSCQTTAPGKSAKNFNPTFRTNGLILKRLVAVYYELFRIKYCGQR